MFWNGFLQTGSGRGRLGICRGQLGGPCSWQCLAHLGFHPILFRFEVCIGDGLFWGQFSPLDIFYHHLPNRDMTLVVETRSVMEK